MSLSTKSIASIAISAIVAGLVLMRPASAQSASAPDAGPQSEPEKVLIQDWQGFLQIESARANSENHLVADLNALIAQNRALRSRISELEGQVRGGR